MDVHVEPAAVTPEALRRYGRLPIAFEVESVLRLVAPERGLAGLHLVEHPVETPWRKDYDAFADGRPAQWADRWDLASWRCFFACENDADLGGAVVAVDTPDLQMLEGRNDVAVLWDIRVDTEHRRRGVGRALLARAIDFARAAGKRRLEVETQNVNVPACRFYAASGFELGTIKRHGYADPRVADEIALYWYLDL